MILTYLGLCLGVSSEPGWWYQCFHSTKKAKCGWTFLLKLGLYWSTGEDTIGVLKVRLVHRALLIAFL